MNDDTYTPCTKCGRPMKYCKGQCCGKPRGCECQEYGPKVCGAIRPGEPKCPYQAVIPSLTVESVGNLKDLADCFVHVSDINTTFYIDDKHRIMTTWAGLVSVENYDFDANPLNLRDQIAYDAKNNTAAIYNKQGANYIFQISDINNDYMLLEDKPQINGVTLEGNKTSADLGVPDVDEVALVFDTVADMKSSTDLVAGSYARTLGFHSVNDGGAGIYKITNTGIANEMDVVAVGSLYAHLVTSTTLRPEMLGAYGDDTHDDSAALQRAFNLNNCNVELLNGKTYSFATTLVIDKHYFNFDGKGATLHYTGSGVGLSVDLSALTSHQRDLTNIENFVLSAPASTDALKVNYANKCKFENIKVYDFPANGINIVAGNYECNFNDIWLACRKASGTVGITGNFGDVEFGNLYGCNVETFIYGKPWGSNNINKIHAWCFNGTIFDDEPTMSDADYATWYANTKFIKVDNNTTANAWGTVINYINCDTYNTCIDWNSYWENLHINNLYFNASRNLVSYTNDYQSYVHRILIDHLNCDATIESSIPSAYAARIPHILFVNDNEYEYVQTQTYTDADNNSVTLYVKPNELKWIELPKPSANLTLNYINVYAFIPFKKEANSGDINLRRPYVGSNGNSFIYPTDYVDDATTAFALVRSFGTITSDNSHLVPKATFTA